MAAHHSAGAAFAVQVVESDESPAQVIAALQSARERGVRLVVGPLTRAAVNAVIEGTDLPPTLLLNVPDKAAAAPASVLAFGLLIEDEANLIVRAALRGLPAGATAAAPASAAGARRHVIVVGQGALARRAGAAFLTALRDVNEPVITLDYAQHGASGVAREITRAPTTSIFLALDVNEAVQVRTRVPIDVPLYATSHLNPVAGGALAVVNDLEGVHFVDMPWLVEPDRPAVKLYRRPASAYNTELHRLYALGIDAYRIAVEWLNGRTRFEVDGVTGWLRVDRERGARVERTPVLAVFRDGRVERNDVLR